VLVAVFSVTSWSLVLEVCCLARLDLDLGSFVLVFVGVSYWKSVVLPDLILILDLLSLFLLESRTGSLLSCPT
jgi:hypothetical protein